MKRTECRGCKSGDLTLVYDFGAQPLAGYFPVSRNESLNAKRYPLDLSACMRCGLMQVTNVPPIEEIFHSQYRYSTSTVPSLVRHFDAYAEWICGVVDAGARILEFGCNDGVLLRFLSDRGFHCKGIDASGNMVQLARAKGLDVDEGFFNEDYVDKERLDESFDLVTCSNVFAHVDNLRSVTAAAWRALKLGGMFLVEVHNAEKIWTEGQFDTIYHEHLTYFSSDTLAFHLQLNGFDVLSTDHTPMHGGSLRVLSRKRRPSAAATGSVSARRLVPDLLSATIRRSIDVAKKELLEIRREYGAVFGYGAAGRAQMFINMTETADIFSCVFDDSTFRQNRFVAGTGVPIRAFGQPDIPGALVVLAWNYAEDIVPRTKQYFDGSFTILPTLRAW